MRPPARLTPVYTQDKQRSPHRHVYFLEGELVDVFNAATGADCETMEDIVAWRAKHPDVDIEALWEAYISG